MSIYYGSFIFSRSRFVKIANRKSKHLQWDRKREKREYTILRIYRRIPVLRNNATCINIVVGYSRRESRVKERKSRTNRLRRCDAQCNYADEDGEWREILTHDGFATLLRKFPPQYTSEYVSAICLRRALRVIIAKYTLYMLVEILCNERFKSEVSNRDVWT